MDDPRINVRYARAYFELATENKVLEKASADMLTLGEVCRQNRDFRLLLKSPVVNADKKIAIVRSIFGSTFSKLAMSFVEIIIRKRREMHLYQIALAFGDIYRESKNIKQVTITTVNPVSATMRNELTRILTEQTGSIIELHEKTDPDIIGGIVVKLEGMQFDNSIRKRLKALRSEFNVNTYIKEF